MMKKIFPLLLVLSLLLCGCAAPAETAPAVTQPVIDYTYSPQSVTYSEGPNLYAFRRDFEVLETDQARYLFEKSLAQDKREACVEATEAILAQLQEEGKPEIYLLETESYDGVCVQGSALYTSLRDFRTVDYAADVLLAAYGEYTHYGLAWGYGSILAQRMGWQEPEDIPFTVPGVPEIADLNLLCFDPAFASEEDILAAKSLTLGFAEAQNEDTIHALLANSDSTEGMELLSGELARWYGENGFDYRPGTLRFGPGGQSVDYIVDTDLAVFYMGSDWQEYTREGNGFDFFPENFLHQDYAETREFYAVNLRQMGQYQELFGLDSYDNDLKVVFDDRQTRGSWSFYIPPIHSISASTVTALMHEYIHALTQYSMNGNTEQWEGEGFATYFQEWYNHYKHLFDDGWYQEAYASDTLQEMKEDPKSYYAWELMETLGRPIDMAKDYEDLNNVFAYSRGYTHPSAEPYRAGAPFIGYLVETYGVEEVTQHIWGDHRELPKTSDELARDWAAYLEENYNQYSKYRP